MMVLIIHIKIGNYYFLKNILNLRYSKINSADDKYLLPLVQNTQKDSKIILN